MGDVGAADGEVGAVGGRERGGPRQNGMELLKGGDAGPLVTQVFSRIRGACLLSSQPSPRRAREIGKNR